MALKRAESLLSVLHSVPSVGKLKSFHVKGNTSEADFHPHPPISIFHITVDALALKLAVSKIILHLTSNWFWCNTSGREIKLIGVLLLASVE